MIVGHKKAVGFLDASARRGMLSQAYLFTGPSGVGKKHTAREFAKWLESAHDNSFSEFAKQLCACASCASIESNSHADVQTFSAPLTMENAREIKRLCGQTPFLSPYRIIIIDEADALMREAGQALLKELEEPSSHTIFFLIARTRDSIPATLASRSTILRFNLVPEKDIGLIAGLSDECAIYGKNRPGLLLGLKNNATAQKKICEAKADANSFLIGSIDQRFAIAEILSKKERPDIDNALEGWITFFAQAGAYHAVRYIQEARSAIRANGNAQSAIEYAGIRIMNKEYFSFIN